MRYVGNGVSHQHQVHGAIFSHDDLDTNPVPSEIDLQEDNDVLDWIAMTMRQNLIDNDNSETIEDASDLDSENDLNSGSASDSEDELDDDDFGSEDVRGGNNIFLINGYAML